MLFADRFVAADETGALDLASASRVWFRWLPPGAVQEEMAWSAACDRRLGAPVITPSIIDYGRDRDRRFEAWSGPPPWPTDRGDDGPPVADAATSIDCMADALFGHDTARGSRLIALQGPAGCGRQTAFVRAARRARLAGFVPVTIALLTTSAATHPAVAAAWPSVRGRSLCVLIDAHNARGAPILRCACAWSMLLEQTLRAPGLHTAILASAVEVRGLDRILLRTSAEGYAAKSKVRRLGARAAEQRAPYAIEMPDSCARASGPWLAQSAQWREQIDAARALLQAGRRAAAERQLRQTIGAAERRGLWEPALEAALALGGTLLARGRARDALTVLEAARGQATCDRSGRALVRVAALAGRAWVDLARLPEAAQVLGTARAAGAGLSGCDDAVRTELARCLWWQGRFAEAAEAARLATADVKASDRAADEGPRAAAIRARIAVATGQPAAAFDWVRRARGGSDASGHVDGLLASAWVHLAVDDADSAAAAATAAAAAARQAGAPLSAAQARILRAEALRRTSQGAEAGRIVRGLRRLSRCVPPLLRTQIGLLDDLIAARQPPPVLVARHVATSGLAGLVWLVRAGERSATKQGGGGLAPCLVAILEACQTAADERGILRDACARLRHDVGAAGVAVFVGPAGAPSSVAHDGTLPDAAVVERTLAAGIAIAPEVREGPACEAAPIVYAGTVIGAIAVRWPFGAPRQTAGPLETLGPVAVALAPVLAAALAARRAAVREAPDPLVGGSAAMQAVREAVAQAAAAPFPVLIHGESGSGKELVARALHLRGARRERPFVALNCAAMPDDLVEAELFGHARGAFTGAAADRPGVFEEAHGGTLFLDEIGELSARAQAKLLRVVQEGELRRVGENQARRVDVRLIAATNRDLRSEVDAGRFREDLLYRLDVVRIDVPPLRDRREDVPALVETYWRQAAARVGSRAALAAATIAALTRYHWPGNVRELQNVLAALVVRCPKRGVVPPTALPPAIVDAPCEPLRLDAARRAFDVRFVRTALARTGGRQSLAARELGVSRQGLTKLMKRLGLDGA